MTELLVWCIQQLLKIMVAEKYLHKTSFVWHPSTFHYICMPFGLQEVLILSNEKYILSPLISTAKHTTCRWTISLSSQKMSRNKSITWIWSSPQLPRKEGYTQNKTESHSMASFDYLGHIINPGRLCIAQYHTKSLMGADTPTYRSFLRSYLDLWNFYHILVPYFTGITHSLKNLQRQGALETYRRFSIKTLLQLVSNAGRSNLQNHLILVLCTEI